MKRSKVFEKDGMRVAVEGCVSCPIAKPKYGQPLTYLHCALGTWNP